MRIRLLKVSDTFMGERLYGSLPPDRSSSGPLRPKYRGTFPQSFYHFRGFTMTNKGLVARIRALLCSDGSLTLQIFFFDDHP